MTDNNPKLTLVTSTYEEMTALLQRFYDYTPRAVASLLARTEEVGYYHLKAYNLTLVCDCVHGQNHPASGSYRIVEDEDSE